jgi:hypothetical protein
MHLTAHWDIAWAGLDPQPMTSIRSTTLDST